MNKYVILYISKIVQKNKTICKTLIPLPKKYEK